MNSYFLFRQILLNIREGINYLIFGVQDKVCGEWNFEHKDIGKCIVDVGDSGEVFLNNCF